jgi:uncharacterized membrane protein (DUF373 family)
VEKKTSMSIADETQEDKGPSNWAEVVSALPGEKDLPRDLADVPLQRRFELASKLVDFKYDPEQVVKVLELPHYPLIRQGLGLGLWSVFSQPVEVGLLVLVMGAFIVLAFAIFVTGIIAVFFSGTEPTLAKAVTTGLNNGLLIFIILELVETVRQQVRARERLYRDLVRNFLVIGIVSSVRHLLAVGAQITLGAAIPNFPSHTSLSPSALANFSTRSAFAFAYRRSLMLELGVSAGIVLVLVACWRAVVSKSRED